MLDLQSRQFVQILVSARELGHNILVVQDEIYVVIEWTPASGNLVQFHSVVGRDITYLVSQFPLIRGGSNHQYAELQDKISATIKVRREFSPSQKWTLYSRAF